MDDDSNTDWLLTAQRTPDVSPQAGDLARWAAEDVRERHRRILDGQRRWYQFNLRNMLVMFALFSMLFTFAKAIGAEAFASLCLVALLHVAPGVTGAVASAREVSQRRLVAAALFAGIAGLIAMGVTAGMFAGQYERDHPIVTWTITVLVGPTIGSLIGVLLLAGTPYRTAQFNSNSRTVR